MGVIEFFDRAYREYPRYWLHPNRDSLRPEDFPPLWAHLLRSLTSRQPGTALDLGAGEGSDAIRLARLGYDVDVVEASAVGAEKIETFARQAGVRLRIHHCDVRQFVASTTYDVVLCNGLMHYLGTQDKKTVLRRIAEATRPGGYNMVHVFSDQGPVPECHKIIPVHCDSVDGIVTSFYRAWPHKSLMEHDKPDESHRDFPPHCHSFIKILAQKPSLA